VAAEWNETVAGHRDRQRQRIVESTMALVSEHGLSDVTMAQVAKQSGIGRATLYKYFPGVEEIVAEHVLQTVRSHHDVLERAVEGVEDPVDAIRACLTILLEYFGTEGHRSASTAVNPEQFSPEVGRDVREAFARMHGLLTDLVVDARRAGRLREDVDAHFTAQLLYQMLAAGRAAVVAGRMTAGEAVERIMEQFLHGAASTDATHHPRV
jgi:AcrR family transcriptional regulator